MVDDPTGNVMQPTVDAIVVRDDSGLTHAAHAADEAARRTLFTDYLERISPHTRRRQAADLALFVRGVGGWKSPAMPLRSFAGVESS